MLSVKELGYEPVSFVDCLLWDCALNSHGYGQIKRNGKSVHMHRVSYEEHVGPIPDGLCVLHKCDNRSCVNPDHLFLGTKQDNSVDAMLKRAWFKPNCHRGHSLSGKNLYVQKLGNGRTKRYCKTCRNIRAKKCRERKKQKCY